MLPINILNNFNEILPEDPLTDNYPRQVGNVAYSYVTPEVFKSAKVIHVSDFAKELNFNKDILQSNRFQDLITGQNLQENIRPYAMAYAGHQFGHWAGQLGDGRAINLFEAKIKNKHWALQLKGAGPTPYSRRGDGFAVLRSSIREHLCSEAMHHLGVPTTRSLSLSLSGDQVLRDKMYDGNAAMESGAIVCRVAPSFVRFGNFEHFTAQGEKGSLKNLADHIIDLHYPNIEQSPKRYLNFFENVCNKTLEMVIHWQRVGFVHGVMNTDNMSILGQTIDYGPYGWLEPYDHKWTPNTTDRDGRYAFGKQPEICLWNLLQLANALYPLIDNAPALEDHLMRFKTNYFDAYDWMMLSKLGLEPRGKDDSLLIQNLEKVLQLHECDMTLFFRELARIDHKTTIADFWKIIEISFYDLNQMTKAHIQEWNHWMESFVNRLAREFEGVDDESAFAKARTQKMNATNPKYVLRNYMAQLVIDDAEKVDYKLLNEVYELLKNPYDEQPDSKKWYAKRPDWARAKVGCSMLSCSS
ncbi:MAG: YdiU family protein [Nonlabens sp.]